MAKATRKEINLPVAFKNLHKKAPMEINWKLKLLMKKPERYHLGKMRLAGTKKNALLYATIMLNLV